MNKPEKKLNKLLQEFGSCNDQCLITGITLDSRAIKKGDLFLACKGAKLDGRNFILDAVNSGAAAVLCEDSLPQIFLPKNIPIIVIQNLREKIGTIAARFYDYPAKKLTMIGVTGTNGKTSVTQYIATVLTSLGVPCGVIGTIGSGFPGKLNPAINTTPDPVTLERILFELLQNGAKAIAMEVSSQGIMQGRINAIDFQVGVFTNLTHEHLDYHGTMEKYGDAKKLLFSSHHLKYGVINADDDFGRSLIAEFKSSLELYAYNTAEKSFDLPAVSVSDFKLDLQMMVANIKTPWGDGVLTSKLLGRFNLSNLLAVVTVLGIMQIDLRDILREIAKLEPVSGRMQVFGGGENQPLVVIDYAHTPDALEKALVSLREYCQGSLWCIFGCGGDRDRSKRPAMGKIAERFSDRLVITNDNPRSENPQQIIDDVLQGLLCPWAAEIECDRRTAIVAAIRNAKAGDVILIAGKGHENYQIIGEEKLHFSDQEVVSEVLG